jgi:hypothetical protein
MILDLGLGLGLRVRLTLTVLQVEGPGKRVQDEVERQGGAAAGEVSVGGRGDQGYGTAGGE